MRRAVIKFAILFALVSVPFWSSFGQEQEHFVGTHAHGSYVGIADFHYVTNKLDTIFDGRFQLRSTDPIALYSNEDNYFSFDGHYASNIPDSIWALQFGTFSATTDATLDSYHYRVGVNGLDHKASGEIRNGMFEGKWLHTIQKIKDSKPAGLIFRSEIDFEKGIPQQAFRIENDSFVLLGRFLRNGLAHDTWSLYSDINHLEDWHFVDGHLTTISIANESEPQITYDANQSAESVRELDLDARYFKILSATQLLNGVSFDPLSSKTSELLSQNAQNYKKIDTVLSTRGDLNFMPNFQVMAQHYPLETSMALQLDSAQQMITKIDSISLYLSNNSSINITRLSDSEVEQMLAAIRSVEDQFLAPIKIALSYHADSILEFLDRDLLWKYLWPSGNPSMSFMPYSEDQVFNMSTNATSSIAKMSYQAYFFVDSIAMILNAKLSAKDRIMVSTAMEEQLVAKMNSLDSTIDIAKIDQELHPAALKIKSVANDVLREYSEERSRSGLDTRAQYTLTCLSKLDTLATALVDISEQKDKIQKEYTDQVWNNFTSTVMTEEVKKRITQSYREVLLPHYLHLVDEKLVCDNVSQLQSLFDSTFDRMIQLRFEDTAKIERKLRKEQNPSAIMKLMTIADGSIF